MGRRSSPRAWCARSSAWSATSTPSTTSTCAPSRASRTCTGSPTPTSWSAASTIRDRSTVWVGSDRQVPIGPETFTLIAGPCAVESRDQTLEAAQMAKGAGATLLRGGAFKPRTSPYAFQGLGVEALEILADVGVATGLPVVTEVVDARDVRGRGRARRHAPDRHPQHGQRRAAPGGRHLRQAGAPQARHDRDHRGVADGRGVRRAARQPRHRPVRARHPDLRDVATATPSTSPRSRRCRRPATCRSWSTRATPPAARTSSCRWPAPRSRSARTACSSTCTRIPRSPSATDRRRWTAASCASSPTAVRRLPPAVGRVDASSRVRTSLTCDNGPPRLRSAARR